MKVYVVLGTLVLVAIVGFFIWSNFSSKKSTTTPQLESTQQDGQMGNKSDSSNSPAFSNPKKSAHYESNTPAHGAVLAGAPINIVIDFNFDLAKPSEMKVINDGKDYGVGETIIDSSKLALRRKVSVDAQDGLYTVEYKACWPDGSCHNGNFQFAIDRSKAANFDDQTGEKEVIVKLSQIQFEPKNVKVSKGTQITWINDDEVDHYINTDSHPGHTYYPPQNSKLLKKGESFELIFNQAGIYPYHCSAHATSMIGAVLVQ